MSEKADATVKEHFVRLASGEQVERDVLNIAMKIREYDPNLKLKYCPPEAAEIDDAPYLITEMCQDGLERFVMWVWELDDRVLERIRAADNVQNNVLLAADGKNEHFRLDQQRRFKAELEESADLVQTYLKAPGTRFTFKNKEGDKITLDSQEGIPAKVKRA